MRFHMGKDLTFTTDGPVLIRATAEGVVVQDAPSTIVAAQAGVAKHKSKKTYTQGIKGMLTNEFITDQFSQQPIRTISQLVRASSSKNNRARIQSAISEMKKKKLVEKVGTGVYKLVT